MLSSTAGLPAWSSSLNQPPHTSTFILFKFLLDDFYSREMPPVNSKGFVANPRYYLDNHLCDTQRITLHDRTLEGFYDVQESPKPEDLTGRDWTSINMRKSGHGQLCPVRDRKWIGQLYCVTAKSLRHHQRMVVEDILNGQGATTWCPKAPGLHPSTIVHVG